MILFPFATQATEPAPGASIEEPRVPHTNLVAYPRCRPMGGGLLKKQRTSREWMSDGRRSLQTPVAWLCSMCDVWRRLEP